MIPTSQMSTGFQVPGLFLSDLYHDASFMARPSRGADIERQMDGLRRAAEALVTRPDHILHELASSAVDLCQADSAGVTLETRDAQGNQGLKWVAVAGLFAPLNNACFPYVNTACGTAIDRAAPQVFRMTQAFYDTLNITAEPVTDGVLIPWRAATVRGTIWIMAHGRTAAFDAGDVRLMQTLASFTAMAMRQKRQQQLLIDQASAAAAATMANHLAHSINNPLQSLTNMLYLAELDGSSPKTRELAHQMSADLERLAGLVRSLLALPIARAGINASDSRSPQTRPSAVA